MNIPRSLIIATILLIAWTPAWSSPPGAAQEKSPPSPSCCASDDLLPPVRLTAGGAFIDTGPCFAHSGPQLLDLDGDGLQDLLVGDFSGHIHFFRNTGTREVPEFAEGKRLEAKGKEIRISNW